MNERIAFLGCGSWGAALSTILAEKGIETHFWHRDSQAVQKMKESRKHYLLPSIEFPNCVNFFSDVKNATEGANSIVVAVPSQNVREVLLIAQKNIRKSKCIINIAKGIENNSLMTMSGVIEDVLKTKSNIVTLSGPSHAEEVIEKNPTAIVSSSKSLTLAKYVQRLFSTNKFRIYTNTDINGVEIGGSSKNVIAIAAGFCDGVGYGDNTKAALVTRGLNEISLLGKKLGAKSKTFFGLAGIGDLIVTCNSIHSRNRRLGELIGRGESLSKILSQSHMVAEGVKTADSIHSLRANLNIEMPICEAVYRVLYKNSNPIDEVDKLMNRDLRSEY